MYSSGVHPEPGFYKNDRKNSEKKEPENRFKLKQVAIRMVEMPPLLSDIPFDGPEAVVKVMADMLKDYDREVVAIVNLKSDTRPINMNVVSMGALDQSIAHPREILKSTVLSNASAVMLVHNHPSGKCQPSTEDITLTARMKSIFDLMGIRFLDHIIVGSGKDYYSFHQHDVLPLSSLKLTKNLDEIELEGFKVAENTVKEKSDAVVTLTVAECGEFYNMGEFHEDIRTVSDALEKLKAIPLDRMHGIPSVGIRITDKEKPDDYTEMDIVRGKTIDLDMLKYVPEIAENGKAQQIIAEIIHAMPDAKIEGEIPEPVQKRVQWIEGREKKADELKTITDKLEQGVKDVFQGENYKNYLNVMAKFPRYSINNQMLIMMQKPDASLCQSFTAWKEMGRYVKKGEKGISILAPAPYKVEREQTKYDDKGRAVFDADGEPVKEKVEVTIRAFKVVKTFDLSQTDGKELPALGVNELVGSIEGYPKLIIALQATCPVKISFELIDGEAKGYYHKGEKRIAIQDGMSEVQTIKTMVHEMAHQKLHDPDNVKGAEKLSKNTIECEAESIAYVVCQHYGINTSDYSFGYVAGWSEGKEVPELRASLDTIRQTASEFITGIDQQLEWLNKREQKLEAEKAENPFVSGLAAKITEAAKEHGFIPVETNPNAKELAEKASDTDIRLTADKVSDKPKRKVAGRVSIKSKIKENKEKAESVSHKTKPPVKEERA